MKKQVLTLWLIILFVCPLRAQKNVVWDHPACVFNYNSDIKVERVEFRDTATVVTFTLDNIETRKRYIHPRVFLIDSKGEHHALKSAEGIEVGRLTMLPEPGRILFLLNFEPLPQNETAFDIRNIYRRYFNIYGICNGKKSVLKELTKARPESKLCPDPWHSDSVTIIGQFKDYDRKRGDKITSTSFQLLKKDHAELEHRHAWVSPEGRFTLRYKADRPALAHLNNTATYYYAVPGDTLYVEIEPHSWSLPARIVSAQGRDTHANLLRAQPPYVYYDNWFWDECRRRDRETMFHMLDSLQTKWETLHNYLANKYQLTPWENHLLHEHSRETFDDFRVRYFLIRQDDERTVYQDNHPEGIILTEPTKEECEGYGFLRDISIDDSTRYMTDTGFRNLGSDVLSLRPFSYYNSSIVGNESLLHEQVRKFFGGQDPSFLIDIAKASMEMNNRPYGETYVNTPDVDGIIGPYRGKYVNVVPVRPTTSFIKRLKEKVPVFSKFRDNEDLKSIFLIDADYEDMPELAELLKNELEGETFIRLCDKDFGRFIEETGMGDNEHVTFDREGKLLCNPIYYDNVEPVIQRIDAIKRDNGMTSEGGFLYNK